MEQIRNIALVLAYDGTRYAGWQRQEQALSTIQGKLEAVLSRLYDEEIEVIGAGRTDSKVHAEGQVANFRTRTQDSPEEIRRKLNEYLPADIRVRMAAEVAPDFHSRFKAAGKIYDYRISCPEETDVFLRNRVMILSQVPDLAAMQAAADTLVGTHDYLGFCSLKKMKKSSVRRIDSIRITTEPMVYDGSRFPASGRSDREDGMRILIRYEGNGFLYHMVRILTGTLIEVGLGQRRVEDAAKALETRKREDAGFLVPAQGLTLTKVIYQEEDF
ncbi:MAG: tRNA pseudouridine(38-40) synthase TruA [Lachnospiraceae bacterium]|nr:tRNA pseudouridine(38-40) synthase TruA [Lachnospiraceae bacterium]